MKQATLVALVLFASIGMAVCISPAAVRKVRETSETAVDANVKVNVQLNVATLLTKVLSQTAKLVQSVVSSTSENVEKTVTVAEGVTKVLTDTVYELLVNELPNCVGCIDRSTLLQQLNAEIGNIVGSTFASAGIKFTGYTFYVNLRFTQVLSTQILPEVTQLLTNSLSSIRTEILACCALTPDVPKVI